MQHRRVGWPPLQVLCYVVHDALRPYRPGEDRERKNAPAGNWGAEVREDHENAFNLAISISDAVSLVTQEHWGAGHRVIREAMTESSSSGLPRRGIAKT
jgi:hypothetical protein